MAKIRIKNKSQKNSIEHTNIWQSTARTALMAFYSNTFRTTVAIVLSCKQSEVETCKYRHVDSSQAHYIRKLINDDRTLPPSQLVNTFNGPPMPVCPIYVITCTTNAQHNWCTAYTAQAHTHTQHTQHITECTHNQNYDCCGVLALQQ